MKQITVVGGVVWDAVARLVEGDDLEIAGYMAFMALLAIFPFLIFLVALAGFIGDAEAARQLIDYMFRVLPPEVARTMTPVIEEVLLSQRGGLLTFGILAALFTASSGVEALRGALNRAYNVTEWRSLVWRRVQSVLFVVIGALALFLVGLLVVLGPVILAFVDQWTPVPLRAVIVYTVLRYLVAFAVLALALYCVHRFLPARPLPSHYLWPGIVATIVLWLTAASLFSFYLTEFANYSVTYGSLGGLIGAMLFFYVTAVLFIFGAELNMAIIRSRRPAWRES